ncbi:hypothetical protein OBBRIDRAFT_663021 [Obba rivulosa]|uniref:DUF6534 domain-containing protein n=1 Tax=Obba rivulosa TaxID=1052685 RepID=A0A8E2AZN2_9APHY|nr:hypothetical protein OBBRIDRAFT_663021 [Obba rivulosa]
MMSIGTRIGSIFGAFTMGIIFNLLLYGVVMQQYHMYLLIHRDDKPSLRFYVSYLFVADTAHTALLIALLYQSLIIHNGQADHLGQPVWILATVPIIGGVVALTVQLVYAARIRHIFGHILIPLLVSVLSFVSTAASVVNSVILFIPQRPGFFPVVATWLVTGTVADILISCILLWHLYKTRNVPDSVNIIGRIGQVAVQTNLLTTICALLDAVLFLSTPNAVHVLFNFPLSKFYTISILSALNSREVWSSSHKPLTQSSDFDSSWRANAGHTHQTQFSTQITICDPAANDATSSTDVELAGLPPRSSSTSSATSSSSCNPDIPRPFVPMWTIEELGGVASDV